MALALAAHSVPGCVVEDYHLGPISRDSPSRCGCQGWDTCRYCCWAFPVEQGIWMEDWDADLSGALLAAQKAAATPLTRAMLDLCTGDMEVPFSWSPKAMARLLDVAILTGNQTAAVNLAKKCQLKPLRRLAIDWRFEHDWKAARTALWAGAHLEDLMVQVRYFLSKSSEDIPFPQALFLNSKLEDWQEIRHLLPGCHDLYRPTQWNNALGESFLECPDGPDGGGEKLSLDKIRAAEDAGVAVQSLSVEVECEDGRCAHVSLLDLAIWCGQPDCAEACVDRSIELNGDEYRPLAWHKRVLRGEGLRLGFPNKDVVASEAQTAVAAAGRASLKRWWKSESSQKGIALYQMMSNMFKGRSFPRALVQEILTFSMPVPKIIDQLDLWEHVPDWMATICSRPTSVHPVADCNTADVEDPDGMQDNGEAEGNGAAGTLLYIEVLVMFFVVCFQGSR